MCCHIEELAYKAVLKHIGYQHAWQHTFNQVIVCLSVFAYGEYKIYQLDTQLRVWNWHRRQCCLVRHTLQEVDNIPFCTAERVLCQGSFSFSSRIRFCHTFALQTYRWCRCSYHVRNLQKVTDICMCTHTTHLHCCKMLPDSEWLNISCLAQNNSAWQFQDLGPTNLLPVLHPVINLYQYYDFCDSCCYHCLCFNCCCIGIIADGLLVAYLHSAPGLHLPLMTWEPTQNLVKLALFGLESVHQLRNVTSMLS